MVITVINICISLYANTLGKSIVSSLLLPAMGK